VLAIRAAGYNATPDVAVQAREARKLEHRQAIWRLFVAAFCAMQVMMMATPSYVAHGEDLAPDLRQLLNWGSWLLTLPVMVFSAGPYISAAWRSVRALRIAMDVPVALGVLVTFVASTGATFDPDGIFGRDVYFDSLTMFVSFLLAGRLLETRARHRVAQVLESALSGMPETALRMLPNGQTETVSVQRLVVGDVVRVPVGQAFPADGPVIEGETRADESLLTGESTAVPKACGQTVVAGSLNLGAPVLMRIDRVGQDTRLEGIVSLMRDAMSQRPAVARAADRWAAPFLWAVLVIAAGAAAVWSVIEPSRAVWVAVSVLIVTCPCALSLAAPSALLSAASALARRGMLLQRLDALEALTLVQRFYLDKTGTVTDEHLQWRGLDRLVVGTEALSDLQLMAQAADLAGWSSHPVSKALKAAKAQAPLVWTWLDIQETPGQGLQALDNLGRAWRLGRATWVGGAGVEAAQVDEDRRAAVWFGRPGDALIRFDFEEAMRPDARAAVDALRAQGLDVVLLSGDRVSRAQHMAEQLGSSDPAPEASGNHRLGRLSVIGGATPESKLIEVANAQAQGLKVAMVGDGINDAPVLARADVSFAMGQGALVARAQADAVVASNRLGDLVVAYGTAKQCMRVIRQNILWAASYNAACIPLAVLGWLPPWAAGLGMATSSLLVIFNSMRLARAVEAVG
jgi:Cu2+-exporting ATPase